MGVGGRVRVRLRTHAQLSQVLDARLVRVRVRVRARLTARVRRVTP